MSTPAPRVDVLGTHVSATTLAGAVDTIDDWIASRTRTYVCVTSVHGVIESRHDPELQKIHRDSGLTTTDGMPLVWSARRAGLPAERVYGPDLLFAVAARAASSGWRSYFYGAGPGIPDLLVAELSRRYPGFVSVGTHSPPFRPLTPAEDAEVVDAINAARPDLVWVGLSTPKQERWIASHRDRLDAPVLIGVGAAFDLCSGQIPQAPGWMQRSGFEWAFRLAVEPRRLWRRYVRIVPQFAWSCLWHPPRRVDTRSPEQV